MGVWGPQTSQIRKAEVVAMMQGPLLGTLATMLFYGVICMQAFFYTQNYANDRSIIKTLVFIVWALETVHTGLSIHFVEHYLIENFADPNTLISIVWSMGATYFVGFIIAYLANLCFIWRIWLLSTKLWITISLGVLATIRLTFGLFNCSSSFHYTQWKSFREHVYPTMIVGWTLSVVVDSLIACTLCYYLHTRRTGMNRTDGIINRLLFYTINTGALTSCFAILVIIMFLALGSNLAFIGFVQVQSKFYAISLLATLNTRKSTGSGSSVVLSTFDNIALANIPNQLGSSRAGHHFPYGSESHPIEIKQRAGIFTDTDVVYQAKMGTQYGTTEV